MRTYAVFYEREKKEGETSRQVAMWARTDNKRTARWFAKKVGGQVRFMSYYQGRGTWDAPTFFACSDPLPEVQR